MSRLHAAIMAEVLCGLLASMSASAQGTFAAITGAVTDPQGSTVPGATITIVNTRTNYKYTAQSNDAGQYTLANLLEGTYKLNATAAGFQEFTVDNIQLASRDVRRIDVQLQIGAVSTVVEVSGGATLIQTENARISDIKTGETIRALPLALRRIHDFYQLSPQVSKPRGAFYIRFAGSRNNQGEQVIDGTTMRGAFGAGAPVGVTDNRTESYQEVRMDMAGNSAEFAGIGQISIVTRSGTNEFHGAALDTYSTPGFTARNPFSPTSTGDVSHLVGFMAGGPVYLPRVYNGRNRTFFFASLEGALRGPRRTLQTPTVPLAAWRRGDFSGLLPATTVRDPFASNAPFPGNVMPTSRLNPVALKLQERFYPLPNYGPADSLVSQNYRIVRLQHLGFNPTTVLRFDHRFTDRAFASVRFTRTDWNNPQFSGSLPTIDIEEKGERHSRSASAAYTHTIRPTLLSETRWGFVSDNIPVSGPINGKTLVQELGLQGLAPNLPDIAGLFNVSFAGLGLTGISGAGYCEPCANHYRHSFIENLSWFRGRHSIKVGFQASVGGYKDYRPSASLFGNHSYSNRFSNFPYADFLLGIPTTASREMPPLLQDNYNWEYGAFFTDEYKVRSTLTLTYGVRYDVRPGYISAGGRQSVFDIATGKIVVPDGALGEVSALMPRGYVEVVEASQAGFASTTLIRADTNNFAPRFGAAWRPFGEHTVLRGGYGIFFDLGARTPTLSSVPFRINEPAFTNPTVNPTVVLPLVFPQTGIAGPTSVTIPAAVRPDLRIPYSMQYTATVEHQRWDMGFRLSYTGTNTRQGVWGYDYNQPVADGLPYVSKPRAYPKYPGISYVSNGAGHQYHGMTVEAIRRMNRGLHLQVYYTLARDIGDLENGESPENAYDRQRERAIWSDIPTHRFSTNALWEIPVGKGKSLLSGAGPVVNGILGGWRLGVIFTYDSGAFLTPLWTGPDPTGTRFTASATPANVTLRPNHLKDAKIQNPTPQRWFDPAAFAPPSAGSFGTSAKGVIKGTPSNVWHGNLAKNFIIKERIVIRPEFVVNNLLNHPNYQDPALNISQTAQVGVITNVSDRNYRLDGGVPRVAQFILRVEW